MSEQTRQRIHDTAERLDFRPDSLAKSFASGRSSTVGFLLRTDPTSFAMQALVGAQKALGSRDLATLMYYAGGRADMYQEYLRRLRARRVDGVIFIGGRAESADETYPSIGSALAVPTVYAYARSDDPADISVVPDGEMAGRLAGMHLIEQGRSRIAHITGPANLPAVIDRAAGLGAALNQAGLRLVPREPLCGDWEIDWGIAATKRILARRLGVDAIFCGNDEIALGAHRTLREAGARVPDDVAIVGYDNWSKLRGAPDPLLTTVDPDLTGLGEMAVAYLLRALDGELISGVKTQPCVLVPGQSTLGPDRDRP